MCLSRSKYGLAVAMRLMAAAVAAGDELTRRLGERMEACASPLNMFIGDGMEYMGEAFKGHGSLYGCGVKICTSCSSRQRRKNRKRVLSVFEEVVLRVGEHWRFFTLTMPDLPGVPLFVAMMILGEAWDLFRRRSIWVDNLNCGVKALEFTLGNSQARKKSERAWSLALDGYHPHIHLLGATRWIRFEDLQREWTDCVLKSFQKHRDTLKAYGLEGNLINTKSGLCFVNVQLVVDREVKGKANLMGKAAAIFEVTKYITKTDSWLKMPAEELLAFGQACSGASKVRWPRMFEVLGRFHGASGSVRSRAIDEGLVKVDTEEACKEKDQVGLEPFLDKEGVFAGEIEFKLNGDLTAGEVEQKAKSDGVIGAALAAAKSLNINQLSKQAPRWLWIYELERRVEVIRRRRMENLASKYPNAKFITLSGLKWYQERYYMVVKNG